MQPVYIKRVHTRDITIELAGESPNSFFSSRVVTNVRVGSRDSRHSRYKQVLAINGGVALTSTDCLLYMRATSMTIGE